ncbi:NAD(P)-binding protein, partial [Dentipellis sp. KUC8613]
MSSRPIIIVTGANNGIGFGTCRRLLDQLSQPHPTDAKPQFPPNEGQADQGFTYPCDGLTLIMACRNAQRAEAARDKLLKTFEEDVQRRRHEPGHLAHAKKFRENLEIKIHKLDLASVQSVLEFGDEIGRTYPYISRVIFNAGVAPFLRLQWVALIKQIFTDFLGAVTSPRFYVEEVGLTSDDGLGWVWQCNVFGHYVLYRVLQPLLAASANDTTGPGRVIWVSSLEALPEFFDKNDWQLIKTAHPYEASKFQVEILGTHLDTIARQDPNPKVRHLVVHPGVVYSSIDATLIPPILHKLKHLVFYLARWFGSPNHPITHLHGAAAAVHVALVSIACIPLLFATASKSKSVRSAGFAHGGILPSVDNPVRFHSITDRWGNDAVGVDYVHGWDECKEAARNLEAQHNALYKKFLAAEGRKQEESAS